MSSYSVELYPAQVVHALMALGILPKDKTSRRIIDAIQRRLVEEAQQNRMKRTARGNLSVSRRGGQAMNPRVRKYYTLLVKEPDMGWSPQFGDYKRSVVLQEQADIRDDWPKGTLFKIVMTSDRQGRYRREGRRAQRCDHDARHGHLLIDRNFNEQKAPHNSGLF